MRVEVEVKNAEAALKRFGKFRREHKKAVVGAVNDTTRNLRTRASEEIRKEYAIKQKAVNSRISREFARPNKPTGKLRVKEAPRIPIKQLDAKQIKAGVSYKLKRNGGRETIKSAFGPNINKLGNHVYRRTGKSRTPIEKLPGVSLASKVWSDKIDAKLEQMVNPLFYSNYARRINLAKVKGRL